MTRDALPEITMPRGTPGVCDPCHKLSAESAYDHDGTGLRESVHPSCRAERAPFASRAIGVVLRSKELEAPQPGRDWARKKS